MARIFVKDWRDFQHYKDRSPLWIKLHRKLLDNQDFHNLSDGAARALVLLWLIASENDGEIPSAEQAAWRLRQPVEKMRGFYDELLTVEFFYETDIAPAQDEPWASRYIPDKVREQVLAKASNKCRQCPAKTNLEIDHVQPISKGGTSDIENLQVLCRSCNRKKRTKLYTDVEQVATQNRSLEKRREETEKSREDASGNVRKTQGIPELEPPQDCDLMVKVLLEAHPKIQSPVRAEQEAIEAIKREAANCGGMKEAYRYLLVRTRLYKTMTDKWPTEEKNFIVGAPKFFKECVYRLDEKEWVKHNPNAPPAPVERESLISITNRALRS